MSDIDKIQDLENAIIIAKHAYLQKNGWEYSSSYPGSYWLWRKEIPESGHEKIKWFSGIYVLNLDNAIRMQRAIDNWFSKSEEEVR